MPLVCETHGNAMVGKRPEFLDEPIVEFLRPFSGEKGDNLGSSVYKLRAISPSRVRCVGERYFLGIAGIPAVFCETNLLNGGVTGERWEGWASGHDVCWFSGIRFAYR